jgi:predicted PurR-regulated permease PerM
VAHCWEAASILSIATAEAEASILSANGKRTAMDPPTSSSAERSEVSGPDQHSNSYPPLIGLVATIAALYFGRDIFMPLATAVLLTFALAPVVSGLRRLHVPRPAAVITVALGAFAGIILFGMVVANQLGSLAENLPLYQKNIETKMQSIKDAKFGEGIFDGISRLLEKLGRQIEADQPPTPGEVAVSAEPAPTPPLPVQIIEPALQPLQVLETIIGPLIQPIATGGIVVVVVIFMLLRREDLRDRFIRLVGADDLHRTTEALQEAGKRVGQYLLMQLIVNVTYAIPIGIGLWVIGVPNALLWGSMAMVLRFVPFIGPVIASIFPLALALAVDPGWSMLLWTAALFVALELLSNNVIEPWLYGSRTGLSPLAIIVAAILWTWLWGPVGLLLSTPLTVCLVVLGRHVPSFEFLDVMFGNKPVLEPPQQLYQRLLAGDPDEATDRAEEFLEDHGLITFYESVAIPALALGEFDRARGVMTAERRQRIADSALALVDNLEDYAIEESLADDSTELSPEEVETGGAIETTSEVEHEALPDGMDKLVVCVGGRGELDNAAMAMLAQVLKAHGATAKTVDHLAMQPTRIRSLDLSGAHAVVIGFLNLQSVAHARYMVRRIRRTRSSLRVGVVFWMRSEETLGEIKLGATIGSDFVAHTMREAVSGALSDEEPQALKSDVGKPTKRKPRVRATATNAG